MDVMMGGGGGGGGGRQVKSRQNVGFLFHEHVYPHCAFIPFTFENDVQKLRHILQWRNKINVKLPVLCSQSSKSCELSFLFFSKQSVLSE